MDRSAFLQAMANMNAMKYTTPKINMSAWKALDNMKNTSMPIDITPFLTNAKDFTNLTNSSAPSGAANVFGALGHILNDTLGQPSGYVTSMADKVVKDWNKNFNGKNPWYKELGGFLNDANPADVIGGTLVDGVSAGAKQQWNDWTNMMQGKFSWGDIPSFGFLDGMANSWKHGSDILGDMGVKNQIGQTAGGLGLDVLLDPLTYLTGGLSAAGKLGKLSEASKMSELAGNLGMKVNQFKNVDEFAQAARDTIAQGHGQSIMNVVNATKQQYADFPHLVDEMVATNAANHEALLNRTLDSTVENLKTQVNAARNSTINQHINDWGFAIPFTKGKTFVKAGEYGANNLLHRSEALVDKPLVDNLINKAANGNQDLASTLHTITQARYGVDHTGQLSKTMFEDLHDNFLKPIIDHNASDIKGLPHVDTSERMVGKALSSEDFTKMMDEFKQGNVPWKDVQKQLDEVVGQVKDLPPVYRKYYGTTLSSMIKDYWDKAPTKNFNKVANARKAESMAAATKLMENSHSYSTVEKTVEKIHPHGTPEARALKDTHFANKQMAKMVKNPYDKLGNYTTKLEDMVNKKTPFNPRSLATSSKFINSMGEHITDAHSQRIGETARYSRSMDKVSKILSKYEKAGGNKEELMNHAIYLLENQAPDHLGGKAFLENASPEAKNLAAKIKPILDKLGKDEQASGVLDRVREHYFPHVVNKDPETMKAMGEFFDRHPELNGLKSASSFNNQRQAFQTLAQKDNYIAKIEKAIQAEKDPLVQENLRAQQERVANMFDTNVVSALQRRIKEGVRARAMQDMQTKLSKYGMMKSLTKGMSEAEPEGLTKLSSDEAKKLGLKTVDAQGNKIRHYIHPAVLKGLKRVDEIFTAEGMNKFVRHMNAFSDVWRPLVTYYKPSHYINNWIGNIVNNMAAGIKVGDYRAAGKLLKGYRNGTLTDSEMKIIDAAYKHNVISGGFLYDSHATFQHDNPSTLEKVAKAVGDNKVIKKVRHGMGEQADDISRLANFINGMHKYGSSAEAAKQVRTYLFNYNEMTNTDRTMRTIVPFWNWMKRNVPLQMKLLLENPKFAMNNKRVADLFNDNQNGAGYQKESGLHIPKGITDMLGAQNEYYTQNSSPVLDLNNVLNPTQELGSMNPTAKMILEMALNRQFFTGSPISYGSNTVQAKDVPSYLAKNFGIAGNLYDMLSGKKSPALTGVNLLHSVTKVNSKNPNGGN